MRLPAVQALPEEPGSELRCGRRSTPPCSVQIPPAPPGPSPDPRPSARTEPACRASRARAWISPARRAAWRRRSRQRANQPLACFLGSAMSRRYTRREARHQHGYPQSPWPTSTSSRCTACRRSIRPTRRCSSDITLAFLPGAKIGVLGYNGAGKSTLLRIMAGRRHRVPRRRAARARRDGRPARAGAPARREQGRARQRRGRRRRDARRCSTASTSWRRTTPTRRPTSSPPPQARIDAADAWNLDTKLEYAMDALRLPPADADVDQALRRRAPPRRAVPAAAAPRPTCCCSTSRPTTSTPSRSPGSSATWPTTRARSSPSPTIATSSTTSPAGSSSSTAARGIPYRGQLLLLARAEAEAPGAGGEEREGAPDDDRRRARVGAPEPQGPAQTKPKARLQQLRGAARPGAQRQARPGPDPHPGRRRAWATSSCEAENVCARASATAC